jgi:8-oxo-dGTP pyrophosphatase MutT (NUDIX family)
MKRISARAVLCSDSGHICLMYRLKQGVEYWVAPGGQIEDGETPIEALQREVMEEVGSTVELLSASPVFTFEGPEHLQYYFSCLELSRTTPQGPEHQNFDPDNIYRVQFVPVENLAAIDIKPAEVKADFIAAAYQLRAQIFKRG